MIRKQLVNKLTFIALGAFLVACGSDPVATEDVVVEDVDTMAMELEVEGFESPDEDYHLPSSMQVASIFKKSGLNYSIENTNSVDKASNYTSDVQGKLNFGVYSADLAYCIANGQTNDARKFITAIQGLAEQQGMESVFENKDLMDRFDTNLEVQDSIESIIVEIHEKSQEYLEENDMSHIAAIHYAGAWSEGMFIGYHDYQNNESNREGVGAKLTEQMEILSNIIKGLKDKRNADEGLLWVIDALIGVQSVYDEFESVKALMTSNDVDELVLTDEEINQIGGMINNIRLKIVE